MQRLIYVSESKIAETDVAAVIPRMVAEAQKRNAHLGVTGALIYTGTNFAQVLEGRKNAIDELMSSISKDDRHESVWIVNRSPVTARQFSHWAMVYQGPSHFVSSHVTRLFLATSETEKQRSANWLIELAREFGKP